MTDIFAIQDEIGRAISEALKLRLAPGARTVNIEAYQHYLKGQYYRVRYTAESLAKAKGFFEQALAIDPNYASAYSGLAGYYNVLAALGMKSVSDVAPLAKSAAERALAIDPANSEAHSVLASVLAACDYDWKAADTHFRQAMAAEPVQPTVQLRYVLSYLLPWGRIAEALGQCRLGLETDPLSIILHFSMAMSLYSAKQYQETIAYARGALEIDPNFYLIWHVMGLAQLRSGCTQEAITSFTRTVELAPWYSVGLGSLAATFYQSGDRERSQEWAHMLVPHRDSYGAAIYFAAAGAVDAMFEALDGANQQRHWHLSLIQYNQFFEPYRADPRFRTLLQRMNLA
jgi:Tfp pilus assembly protein PilF